MRSRIPALLTGLLLGLVASAPAHAAPGASGASGKNKPSGKTALHQPSAPRRAPPSKSVGSPTEGKLVGGVRLATGEHLRILPHYANSDVRWGLDSLVKMLDRAARLVRKQYPDAVLSVGHLSKAGGGEIDRHASHESGRDADVAFYVKNHLGKPAYADHFVPFRGDGTAPTWPGARFDDARNWAFVAALVTDPHAKVTYIFVATPLRARLLAYAAKIGAPASVRRRAAEVMAQPRGSLPHDDHFHVRIACPPSSEKCVEFPVARRNARPSAGAVASTGRGKPASRAEARAAATPPPAPAKKPAPAPPPPKVEPPPRDRDDEANARTESLVPSLAPIVPGLDSAVIAAPLGTVSPEAAPEPPKPEDLPAVRSIEDPDGVLE